MLHKTNTLLSFFQLSLHFSLALSLSPITCPPLHKLCKIRQSSLQTNTTQADALSDPGWCYPDRSIHQVNTKLCLVISKQRVFIACVITHLKIFYFLLSIILLMKSVNHRGTFKCVIDRSHNKPLHVKFKFQINNNSK